LKETTIKMPTGYLHVSGRQILDSSNTPVKLTGLYSAWWDTINLALFQYIAANGGNCLRVYFIPWGDIETSENVYDMAQMETWAGYAKATGIYLILSINEFGLGNGRPSWAAISDAYTDEVGFFDQTNGTYNTMRTQFSNFLIHLAQTFNNNPFVILGLSNEPFGNGSFVNHDSGYNNSAWQNIMFAKYSSTMSWLSTQLANSGYYDNPTIVPNPLLWYASVGTDLSTNSIWDGHDYLTYQYNDLATWESQLQQIKARCSGKPLIMCEWSYVDLYFTPRPDLPDWATVQTQLTAMNSYMQANTNGFTWYSIGSLYGNTNPTFSQAQSNWIIANVMVGGTGPVVNGGTKLMVNSVPSGIPITIDGVNYTTPITRSY